MRLLKPTTPPTSTPREDRAAPVAPAALARLRAALASRDLGPRVLVFAGSSTTYGANATAIGRRYVNLLAAALQAAYPLRSGASSPATTDLPNAYGARASLAVGVQAVNAGISGTTSADYLTSTTRPQVAALAPRMVLHMIGANDFKNQVPVATFKTNLAAQLAALKASISAPCVHVLVQTYQRFDGNPGPITWGQYGAALAELADADPANVAFVDIHHPYVSLGVPGADPVDLVDTDSIHQTDSGHALMADLLRDALLAPIATTPAAVDSTDTAAPSVPTALAATPGDGLVALTWSASSDNVGVTGYKIYRGGSYVGTTASLSYSDSGRTNGTSYSYTVTAVDAAGNESAPSGSASATPGAAGGGTGATLVSDTFTRADSTNLGSADTGQAWTEWSGDWSISNNKLTPPTSGPGNAVVDCGASDIDVSATITWYNIGGILIRSIDDTNRIGVFIDSTNGIAVYRMISGANTVIASATQSGLAAGTDYTLRVVAKGSALTVYLNGTQVLTYTFTGPEQTQFGAATKVGFRHSTGTGQRFDNLIVKAAT